MPLANGNTIDLSRGCALEGNRLKGEGTVKPFESERDARVRVRRRRKDNGQAELRVLAIALRLTLCLASLAIREVRKRKENRQ
jgi:hypothetical protein